MELNKIYNMDCLDGMRMLPDNSIDLIVTDPPYKIISGGCRKIDNGDEPSGILNRRREKRTDWVEEVRTGKMFKHNDIKFSDWLPNAYRVLKGGTHFYVMVNDRNMKSMLNEAENVGFEIVNILVWIKNNATPNKYYMKNSEFILMFRKGKARNINNMGSKQCSEFPNIIGNKKHPTEKPIELMEFLIKNSSGENETILDPFMGSGTTAIAALNTGRYFIGYELDKNYFDIANQRIESATKGGI